MVDFIYFNAHVLYTVHAWCIKQKQGVYVRLESKIPARHIGIVILKDLSIFFIRFSLKFS